MEIFYYKHDKDICALKGVDESFGNTLYIKILTLYLKEGDKCIVLARRNNYNVQELIQRINLENLVHEIEFFYYSDDHVDLQIVIKIDGNIDWLVLILEQIWFAYEQPTFCIFFENFDAPPIMGSFLSNLLELSWKQIVSKIDGFVFFKSAEDNVVWIGKSSNQNFSFPDIL